MARSTKAGKARLLNEAHALLARGLPRSEAAHSLALAHGLSLRHAYRYLVEAQALGAPVPVEEDSVPVTLKLPPPTVQLLRSQAARSGMTLSELATRALKAYLAPRS